MESGGISRERTKHNDADEAPVKALGRRADGGARCLAIGSLILIFLVGCSLATGGRAECFQVALRRTRKG